MKKSVILAMLFYLLAPPLLSDEAIHVSGYYKNFFTVFSLPAYQFDEYCITMPDRGAVYKRLRIKLLIKPLNWLSINTAYDFSPRIQDPALFIEDIFFTDIESAQYRFDDFRTRIYPKQNDIIGSFGLYHNLDRFFITATTKFADIFIGRQTLSWGSARIINPTDIIAPFTFNELDPEERRGVDAIRIRIPLGTMDELDVGYVAGKGFRWENSAFFLRTKFNLSQTDVSLIVLGFHKHLLIGADIARSIGGAGFWFEAAHVIPHLFNEGQGINENSYFRASLGLDYSLTSKTYGFLEYHFNSAGKSQPEAYLDFLQSTAFQNGSVYLMGKHYCGLGITHQITPLIPFSCLFLFNINDKSITLAPQVEYNIAENIYISAGSYIGVGKRPEKVFRSTDLPSIQFHSEFGAYPDMFYTSFRIYF